MYLTESVILSQVIPGMNTDQLLRAYALSAFAASARYAGDYSAANSWEEVITLTSTGERLLAESMKDDPGIPRPDWAMAMFGMLTHEDLLIDPEKCDLDTVERLLWSDLNSGRSRLPYIFGLELYRRFNNLYPTGDVAKLTGEETHRFLDGTPPGVYHVGHTLIGPLGFIRTPHRRLLPPVATSQLRLWHGRRKGHIISGEVSLTPPASLAIARAFRLISQRLRESDIEASEWVQALHTLCLEDGGDQNRTAFRHTPFLVSDCIYGHERTNLLAHALASSHGRTLRTLLGAPPRKATYGQGSPAEVAGRLDPVSQVQILLGLEDSVLVTLIDQCCETNLIRIPHSEVRSPLIEVRVPFAPNISAEISSSGTRFVREDPTIRLMSLIDSAYASAGAQDELRWRLKSSGANPILHDLAQSLREWGPEKAVESLVLTSRPIASAVLRELHIEQAVNPKDSLGRQILWKCGYNIPHFRSTIPTLNRRFSEFREVIESIVDFTDEANQEKVRSTGVNLFVALEEILQEVVAFNTWMLSSDHYTGKLEYDPHAAVRGVEAVLGPIASLKREDGDNGDVPPPWSADGKNTLGTSLRYLDLLIHYGESRFEEEPSNYLRPSGDLPSSTICGARRFAFQHTEFWADCSQPKLRVYLGQLKEFSQFLARSQLAAVRNGIDHMRRPEDFPSSTMLMSFLTYTGPALKRLEEYRIYPLEYWLQQRTWKRHGSVVSELMNQRGLRVEIQGPSYAYGLRQEKVLSPDSPIIVGPDDLLGYPGSTPCFVLSFTSPYTEYMADYPIIRNLPDESLQEATAPPNGTTSSERTSEGADDASSRATRLDRPTRI